MANNNMSQSVKELDEQLRAYKSVQRRLSQTVQTYEATLSATEPAHGTVRIWANGANINSLVAVLFAQSPQVPDSAPPFYDYMPIFDGNGRAGWQLCMRYADISTISVNYRVISNQEVTLVHE